MFSSSSCPPCWVFGGSYVAIVSSLRTVEVAVAEDSARSTASLWQCLALPCSRLSKPRKPTAPPFTQPPKRPGSPMSGEPLRPKDLIPVTFTLDSEKEKVHSSSSRKYPYCGRSHVGVRRSVCCGRYHASCSGARRVSELTGFLPRLR